ncbi:HEAT repeat domain-containing protein [Pseudoalteromonas ardens]|nr:hypothetical protein [Pseudoalteromonas sp. R96]MDK1310771.1 hypothetical protein [Pseudoalteromonas sp. R96]
MIADSFIRVLSVSNSVECVESAFHDFVERQDFKTQVLNMVEHTTLGKICRKGITLYEDDNWSLLLTLDTYTTPSDVATTFSSESLYSVVSEHHYAVSIYSEHDDSLILSTETLPINTRQLKISPNNHAYVFHGAQEKVVVALHNKSVAREVCPYYDTVSGRKIATYSGTHDLERYKVLTGFLPQFGTTAAPYLVKLTKHKVNAIRWQALVELFKVDHQQAKVILIEFLEDPCHIVRAQANATLTQLTEFEKAC